MEVDETVDRTNLSSPRIADIFRSVGLLNKV